MTEPAIDVVGGVYVEQCMQPEWNQLFGSAGRAARALASTATAVRLHTYADSNNAKLLRAQIASLGNVTLDTTLIPRTISFHYVHPLSVPVIVPPPFVEVAAAPIRVESDLVLRFGMLEGDAIVAADRAVYDPQSAFNPVPFAANGSTAKTLAIVANAGEIRGMSGEGDPEAGAHRLLQAGAVVVVVKRGTEGALVVTAQGATRVPAYRGRAVFSIGSGDVFAAAFAYFWGIQNRDPFESADLASRTTARYCELRHPLIPDPSTLRSDWAHQVTATHGRAYLAGPFFSIGQRWLVEEARTHLRGMGVEVFSPLHDVGRGPAEEVAPKDLAAFEQCDRMLALVDGNDPGTIFEIGYARARGMPVVALAESVSDEDLKMISGSGCEVVDDFATALYFTAWCR